MNIFTGANHNYKIGDKVSHPCDLAPFTVSGIKKDEIEIEGDWSGGTAPLYIATAKDWVNHNDVKPY